VFGTVRYWLGARRRGSAPSFVFLVRRRSRMRRVTARVPRVTIVLAAATLLVGCDAITGSKKPKVELTPSTTTASIAQGANTTITLNIKRTKFDKTLTI